MALTNVTTLSPTSYEWNISGLNSDFNSNNYTKAAIFNQPFTNGQTAQPNGLLSSVNAPLTGTSRTTPTTLVTSGVSGGQTYTAYGGLLTPNGGGNGIPAWFTADPKSFTMPPGRPSDFAWTYAGIDSNGIWIRGSSKSSGLGFLLTDDEWNTFAAKVNLFRTYKGLGQYGFTDAFTGNTFAFYMFNQGVNGIAPMGPSISLPSTVNSGQDVIASYVNRLKDSLNSIS